MGSPIRILKRGFRIILYPLVENISIVKTLYFNFHYFPFRDAVRVPVFLYKGVKLKSTKGIIELDFTPGRPGLVRIGKTRYGFNTKHDVTIWEQLGGKVIFGRCVLFGKGTFFSIGENAELKIENNVGFGGNDKIICKKSIVIGEGTNVSWDTQIIDTDFHPTINTIFKTKNSAECPIIIGKNNWLGFGCTLLKGSITPDNCILAANTTIKSDYSKAGENIILAYEQNARVTAKYITFDASAEPDLSGEPDNGDTFKMEDKRSNLLRDHG